MTSKKKLKRRLRAVEAELRDLRQISAAALVRLVSDDVSDEDREYVIGCPCMDGTVWRTRDRRAWEQEKLAHRTTGHEGFSTYTVIRPGA